MYNVHGFWNQIILVRSKLHYRSIQIHAIASRVHTAFSIFIAGYMLLRMRMYFVCIMYIYNYLCDEHKTSPLSHLNRNPDIGGSCSVRTQCLALLSSLKLSIFNRCLTKQANKLTGIKPQPFDWIFFQFKNVFLLFCFICLLILNMNFLIWYVFVCSFLHIHFG